jgi:hypothetical protein
MPTLNVTKVTKQRRVRLSQPLDSADTVDTRLDRVDNDSTCWSTQDQSQVESRLQCAAVRRHRRHTRQCGAAAHAGDAAAAALRSQCGLGADSAEAVRRQCSGAGSPALAA